MLLCIENSATFVHKLWLKLYDATLKYNQIMPCGNLCRLYLELHRGCRHLGPIRVHRQHCPQLLGEARSLQQLRRYTPPSEHQQTERLESKPAAECAWCLYGIRSHQRCHTEIPRRPCQGGTHFSSFMGCVPQRAKARLHSQGHRL